MSARITPEMWSEYLGVFWDHPQNAHRYIAGGTPVLPGDICLDCGACEGFFVFQAIAAGAAQVVCLEPNEAMAKSLARTFAAAIEEGKVVIQNVALGANDGEATFTFDSASPFGGASGDEGNSVVVQSRTIATVCRELSLERIDFVKMDIEGGEIQAIEGAMPILRKWKPRLAITTYHREFDYAALKAFLLAAGYSTIRPSGCTNRSESTYRPVMLHASP
ncbi:MAG: FkbM family methyltransferase [Chthoniobacterales bacterium]|nr:FkbM family methyltransferase [Chthoniobacterales bacterium]